MKREDGRTDRQTDTTYLSSVHSMHFARGTHENVITQKLKEMTDK